MAGYLWAVIQRHMDDVIRRSGYPTSERQVALKLGISPATMHLWKSPRRGGIPTVENLQRAADGTNTPFSEVLWAAMTDAGYCPPWHGDGPPPKLPSP